MVEKVSRMAEPELALIEAFEKFVDHPYDDGFGYLTVGWGHRILPGEDFSAGLTRAQADALLEHDLAIARAAVTKLVPVPLNDNQRGALRSFVFNGGAGMLQRASFRQALLRGDYEDVPAGMLKYVYSAGRKSAGLLRRRQAEVALFTA